MFFGKPKRERHSEVGQIFRARDYHGFQASEGLKWKNNISKI